jgi:DNA-binding NtrC family response regulator
MITENKNFDKFNINKIFGTREEIVKDNIEVLILDDESIVCERLENHLTKKEYLVETFTQSQLALERLKEKEFDVVVTDLKMAGPGGVDVLVSIKDQDVATQVIIITGYPDFETRLAADYKDAFDYIPKPFKLEEIERKIAKAAKKAQKLQKKYSR